MQMGLKKSIILTCAYVGNFDFFLLDTIIPMSLLARPARRPQSRKFASGLGGPSRAHLWSDCSLF